LTFHFQKKGLNDARGRKVEEKERAGEQVLIKAWVGFREGVVGLE
jgi:hypothetical protein